MAARILLCCRSGDDGPVVRHLHERLVAEFGDVVLGTGWPPKTAARLLHNRDVVAVLCGRWFDPSRLREHDDWLRHTLLEALADRIPIVTPVAIEGFGLARANLPQELGPVFSTPALQLRGGHAFEEDVARLASALHRPTRSATPAHMVAPLRTEDGPVSNSVRELIEQFAVSPDQAQELLKSPFFFISYSRTDRAYVEQLLLHLQSHGVETWADHRIENGDAWIKAIQGKIDGCIGMIVIMTPAARDADWVLREVTYAQTHGKRIFPLLLAGGVFLSLADLQHEDVRSQLMPSERFIRRLRTQINPFTG